MIDQLQVASLTMPENARTFQASPQITPHGDFYKIQWRLELPMCSCGKLAIPKWENNGFTEADGGPEHNEVIGYDCPTHGRIL